jgi:formylglycine-generating enzyme required for sulfatase activity
MGLGAAAQGAAHSARSPEFIVDTREALAFEAGASAVAESAETVDIPVVLTAATIPIVTVHYATSDDTAVAGIDYMATSGTLTFAPGETVRTIAVPIIPNTLDEANRTFLVTILSPTNARLGPPAVHTLTITDDDAPPTVSLSRENAVIAEAGGVATFIATLSAVSGLPVTVDLAFSGTATPTTDYTRSGTQIVIAAGSTSGGITVTAVQDALDEDNEIVIVDISAVTNGSENGTQQQTTTITDDDAPPTVALSRDNAVIPEAGGVATLTATLSAASGLPVTVDLAFSGTATLTADYTRSGTQIVIAAGSTSGSIAVTAVQDGLDETDETVIVDISAVTNGTENGTQQQTTTITDDDMPPTVTLSRDNAVIAEAGGVATFTATLSAVSGLPVTVELAFSGTATLAADYTRSGTQIVIAAGSSSGCIALTAVQDELDEPDETVIVDISAVTNGTQNGAQQQITTITDDDAPPTVTLSRDNASIAEAGGVATLTATLSAVSGLPVTVDLAFSGTATLTSDYTRSGTQIVIAAGSSSGSITVTALQDGIDEPDETVVVDISAVTNGTGNGTQQQTTTIVDDDSTPVITQGGSVAQTVDEDGSPLAWNAPTLNATDADGDTLTWSKANGPAHGTATVSGTGASPTTFTYAPTPNWNGSDSFVVQVADPYGGTDTITVNVTVNPRNDPPNFTVPPSVTGVYQVGQTLTAVNGTWDDTTDQTPGTLAYTHQWRWADDAAGANVADIPGATGPAYVLQSADNGKHVCVRVTATDDGEGLPATRSTSVSSAWSALGCAQIPYVGFALAASVLAESAGEAALDVQLSTPSTLTVTVQYATSNATAQAGSDYTACSGALTFAPGETTKTITVPITGDALDEDDETLTVALSDPTNALLAGPGMRRDTIAHGSTTITMDFVTIGDAGNAADTTGDPNPCGTVAYSYRIGMYEVSVAQWTPVNAAAGIGNAGTWTGSQPVASISWYDAARFCNWLTTGSTASGVYTLSGNSVTSIMDHQSAAATYGTAYFIPTENEWYKAAYYDSSRSAYSNYPTGSDAPPTDVLGGTSPFTAVYDGAIVTPTAPADVYNSGGLSPYGTMGQGGNVSEWNETMIGADAGERGGSFFFISNALLVGWRSYINPTYEIYDIGFRVASTAAVPTQDALEPMHTLTITDDDPEPSVSVGDATVTEGNAGATSLQFEVTLSAASGRTVTVDCATADGTATAGGDYTALPTTTVTFIAGDTSETVSVEVNGDELDEGNETILLNLSNPVNAAIADAQGVGTITDDDPPPTVTLSRDNAVIAEAGGIATFTATLSAISGLPVTVELAFSGTATLTADYARSGTQIVIAAGSTSGGITVTAVQDALDEDNETVVVDISAVTNGTESGTQQQTTTIADDDAPPTVAFAAASSFVVESAGTATLSVNLDGTSASTVTVQYATSAGTATAGSDYTAVGNTLTFASGETTKTISVPILDDTSYEGDETVILTLSAPTNAVLGTPASHTLTIQDDEDVCYVTTTADSGVGTLRAALDYANVHPRTHVVFNISTTDPGYNATDGTFTIRPTSQLPDVTADHASIDATTQTVFAGNTNPVGPEVVLNGALAGAASGIQFGGTSCLLRGLVINGFSYYGVFVGDGPGQHRIEGCYVGTDPTGTKAVSNATAGTYLVGIAICGGSGTVVGGTSPGAGNLISGNGTGTAFCDGVALAGTSTNDNRIEGNLIGTDRTGTVALGNSRAGVVFYQCGAGNVVGGNSAASRNVISGNLQNGVIASEVTSPGNIVSGNYIGTDYSGDAILGNLGAGVLLLSTQGVTVGGTASGTGNLIASNAGSGICVESGLGNTLRGNSIVGNGQLGIDLGGDGVTPNDADDTDSGANDMVNTPEVRSVTLESGNTRIAGTIDSGAPEPITVEVFANAATDPSGYGEGETFLGSAAASGGTWSLTVSGALSSAVILTATATDGNGNTSEFSQAMSQLPPSVAFHVASSSTSESTGTADIPVVLSAATMLTVTVHYATGGGTAVAGSDYTATSGTLTFAPGETTKAVSVPLTPDTLDENDETLDVTLSSPANATLGASTVHTLTIIDDDAPPTVTLSRDNASIAEAGGIVTLTATLSALSGLPVTVDLAFSGTATLTADYTCSGSQIVIAAGSTSGSITMTAVQDGLDEPDETAVVDISAVTNGTENGTQQQTISVVDDDAPPTVTLSLDNALILEAHGVATFTATLSAVSGFPVTVDLAFSGTATFATDYTRSATQIVIVAGSTSGSITVTAVHDALDDAVETVTVDISGVTNGTENGSQQQTVTIVESNVPPTVTLSRDNGVIAEAGGIATFTATLSVASGLPVTVDLAFSGTATLTADCTRSGTQVVIAAGSTSGSITVTAVQDGLDEPDETVVVDISAVTNGTESGTQQQTTTIADDDMPPTVILSRDNAVIAEAAGVATFTATLSAVSGLPVTVDLAFSGTATLTSDYTRSGTQVLIGAGSPSASITITAVQDALDEDNETVVVDVSTVTNGTENSTQQQTTTITDDDMPPTVTLTRDNASIAEAGGIATFTATLSAVSGLPVTVDLAFSGTATFPTDYTRSGTQVVIAAGSTNGSITVTAVQDALDEPDETVVVDIGAVTNGSENGTQQQTTTITDDDAPPTVALSRDSASIAEAGGIATFTATLSAVSGLPVTVDLAFSGTATLTADYTRSGTQVVIAAGSLSGSISVTAVQDGLDEADDTVAVDISAVTNGTENGTQQQTTTITDDDMAPTATLSRDNALIAEAGGVATFAATLSAVSGLPVTVDLAFGGTATFTADYTRSGAQIVIAAGSTNGSITVNAVQDGLDEPDETVIVDISAVTNGTENGTQQQTITIADDDSAPVITQGASVGATMDEDGAPAGWSAPTVGAADADGGLLTWSKVSGPAHGAATVSGSGAFPTAFTYTPTVNWNGSDSFVVQVADPYGNADTITIQVTVNPRNDPPNNTGAPSVTGTHHAGQMLSAASGAWNDSTDLAPGTLTLTRQWRRADDAGGLNAADIGGATGTTHVLQAADNGKYVCVRVTATDNGEGLPAAQSTSEASAWTLVTNAAPVITQGASVARTMDEDGSPLAWNAPTLNATDADGDTLTWSKASDPAHGTATVAGTGASPTTFTYAPMADWNGSDSFVVQVADPYGGTDSVMVQVTVNPRNDPPVITGQSALTVREGSSLEVRLADLVVTDPDNTYPGGFTLRVLAGANYAAAGSTVTPHPGFTGVLAVPVTVNDGGDDSAPFGIAITVLAKLVPTITWAAPGAIVYGTALSSTQLSAVADTPGTLIYDPPVGTVLGGGSHILAVAFTPTDGVNWAAVGASVPLTVEKATLTATGQNASRPYGDGNPTLVVACTGYANGDDASDVDTAPSATCGATPTSPAGAYAIVPAGGADSNYTFAYVDGTLTVDPAPLTCTADDKSRAYGNPNPALSIRYAGLKNGQTAPATPPTAACAANETSAVGAYPITLSGGVDPNYALSLVSGTLTIGKADQAISFAGIPEKTYGDAPFTVPATATSGLPPTLSSSNENVATIETGRGDWTVTISSAGSTVLTARQVGDGNWNAAPAVQRTLTVVRAALTVTANSAVRRVGQPNPTFTCIATGLQNGDTLESIGLVPAYDCAAEDTSAPGPYAVTPSGPATTADYAVTYVPGMLTVTNKQIPVISWTVPDPIVYGTPLSGTQLSAGADTDGTFVYAPVVGTVMNAGVHGLAASFTPADAANWAEVTVTVSLTVDRAVLTARARNASRPYGDENPVCAIAYTGFVDGDDASDVDTAPSATCGATPASPAGAYAIVPAGGADNNYTFAYLDGTLAVDPAPLTCTADDQSRAYGNPNPPLTVRYSGLKNGQTAPATPPTAACAATEASAVGAYPITLSGGADPNYTLSLVAGALAVGKADQTISFAGISGRTYGDVPFTVSVSATSGMVPTLRSSIEGVATVAAARGEWTVRVHGAGETAITAEQAGDGNWNAAPAVQRTFTVERAPLIVSADDATRRIGQPNPTFTCTGSGLQNGDALESIGLTPVYSCTADLTSIPGLYPVTPAGPAATANYTVTYVPGTLTVASKRIPVITWAAPDAIVYGTALSSSQLNAVADTPGTLVYDPPAGTVLNAGAHDLTVAFVPTDGVNWVPAGASVPLTVEKATLTATGENASRPYGDGNPAFTVSCTGFANGDDDGDLDVAPTASCVATQASPTGVYPIRVEGGADGNYIFAYENGTLTVEPVTLICTAEDKARAYGQTNPALTVAYTGLRNGDTAPATSPTAACAATEASAVGAYPITLSGGVDPNYALSLVAGVLAVGKADQTISFAGVPARAYGDAPFTISASATSGIVPTLSSSNEGVATVAASRGEWTVTVHGAGETVLTATQLGDGNWNAAPAVPRTLTVERAPLVVTVDNATRPVGQPNPTFTCTPSGLQAGDTLQSIGFTPVYSCTADLTSIPGPYPVTPAGPATTANYAVTYVPGTLTVTAKQVPVITWAAPDAIVYGAALSGTQLNGVANLPGTFVYDPPAGTVLNAGAHGLAVTFTPDDDANWTSAIATVFVDVARAALTVTADSQTKPFGAELPTLTATWSGFVNGDDAGDLDTPVALSTTATATSDLGVYPIAAMGASGRNYDITHVSGTLTVVPASHTVRFLAGANGSISGPTTQTVLSRGDALPVTAVPSYMYVFRQWSDGSTASSRTETDVTEDRAFTASFRAAGQVPPSGTFLAVVDAAAVAAGRGLWHLSGTYSTIIAGNPLVLSLVHDPSGRITGTATYTVAKATVLAMPVKGSVNGSAGSVALAGTLKGASPAQTVNMTLSLNLAVDTADRQLTGWMVGSVTTGRVTTAIDDPLVLDLPASMDGTWTLALDLDQAGRAVAGTALLTLSNGVIHSFVTQGRINGANAVLDLQPGPFDPAARGIRIRTTITSLDGAWARLNGFSGRGYGQTVGW